MLAADSFRVRANPKNGVAEVRGFERHLERFRRSARETWCGVHRPGREELAMRNAALRALRAQHPGRSRSLLVFTPPQWSPEEQHAIDTIDTFLERAREQIADYGEGWPRLELWLDSTAAQPRLDLQLRPLPPLEETIELRTAGHVKVEHPEVKGPNLPRYAQLNAELGAEALLLDPRGQVREGATTSLVWWPRAGESASACDALGQYGGVAESRARVDSVTEHLLVAAGGHRLVGTKPHRRRIGQPQPRTAGPAQLMQHEVWAVNALHGIRVVTGLDGVPLPLPDERRLRWFRDALDRSWEPVLE